MFRAAVVQMVSGPEVAANLTAAASLIAAAAEAGAQLVVLPENFACMGVQDGDKLLVSESYGIGPIQDFLSAQAAHHRLWLVGGTIPLKGSAQTARVFAACLLYDHNGACVARYDKMHLFDVDLPGSSEGYRESATLNGGNATQVCDTPFGRLGLAVCYDLRFPEIFRQMSAPGSNGGAELFALPSAFTRATGQAHWEILLRARAVENLAWMIAPDQGGRHANGRETWGHSMIVGPWGEVAARVEQGPGVALAEIDLTQQHSLRKRFPVLQHRRL